MKVAYALNDEYAGTVIQRDHEDDEGREVPRFLGGVIAAGESDIDVAKELEEGGGTIVVDENDRAAVIALDAYPALERVKAPDDADQDVDVATGYAALTAIELRADLKRRGIEGSGRKDDLIAALEEHDRRLAADELDDVGSPLTVEALVAAAGGDNSDQGGDE